MSADKDNDDQRNAKISFGDLLYSTIAAKDSAFALDGCANDVVANFPVLPGLKIEGVAGIDAQESLGLPISNACGDLFFQDDKSPRSVTGFDPSEPNEAVAIIPSDRYEFTNPHWPVRLVQLAERLMVKMGAIPAIVDVDGDLDLPIRVCMKDLLIFKPNSMKLNSDLYNKMRDVETATEGSSPESGQSDSDESNDQSGSDKVSSSNTRSDSDDNASKNHSQSDSEGEDEEAPSLSERMFATLLIQLPSVLSSQMAVENGDVELCFQMGSERWKAKSCAAQYSCHYLCHYKQCPTRCIIENGCGDLDGGGYRAVFVADIEWRGTPENVPVPPPVLNEKDLNAAMGKLTEVDRKCFVVPLTTFYSERELDIGTGLCAISERDMSIVAAIEHAGYECDTQYSFRLGVFGGYHSCGFGGAITQTPINPTWFNESGFVVCNESVFQEIDWRIYSKGGNVIAKEPLWVDKMLETDDSMASSDKLPVFLLAYCNPTVSSDNAESQPEQKKPRTECVLS